MEFYVIISKKGIKYIKNSEAILMKLARQKIYRNFSKSSRIKEQLLFLTHANHDDEYFFADLIKDEIWIEDSIVNNELIKEINLFLMQKPEIIKKIFYLYYYLELSIPEIAKALSLGESNVKNKLYRTLKELRKIYL